MTDNDPSALPPSPESVAASAPPPPSALASRRSRVRDLVLAAAKARAQQALMLADGTTPLFAPYSPSPTSMIHIVWEFLDTQQQRPAIAQDELVVDLGCGDARWLIAGVQRYQCTALGIEIDGALVTKARAHVQQLGLAHKIRLQKDDIMNVDISHAKLVIVYAFAESLHGIRAHLESQLGANASVLSIGVRPSFILVSSLSLS
ncbi:Fam173 family, partial [Globisporangium splendens]